MNRKIYNIFLVLILLGMTVSGQTGSTEDTLQKGINAFLSKTTIGGYGNAIYQRDFNTEFSTINLERFVVFVGHEFNKKISIYSELELEDSKIEGGEEGGELALEQCYLKFNLNKFNYIVAGLFIPRIGILNENHLPNNFNGNERTQVETYIIPSTWRELGIGFYGRSDRLPISYTLGITNGLNSAGFEHGTVIREGRYEGKNASANNMAVTASILYDKNNLKAQISGYIGGSVGLAPKDADMLSLESGFFGTPVMLSEANVQYEKNGWQVRILGSLVSIPKAEEINRAYANNTPETAYGFYGELAYDVLRIFKRNQSPKLNLFVRYEKLDMNSTIPTNGIIDGTLDQQHIITGINYLPIPNVVVKMDMRFVHTGNQNPNLIINPNPSAPPYQIENTFLNLGIGFSF